MLRPFASFLVFLAVSCSAASAATEQWIEVSSPHFTVISNTNDKQARHILDQFERMRWLFQTLFPHKSADPALPIVILASKDQKSFRLLEPAAYLAKGQLAIGGLFLKTQDTNYILLRLDSEEEHPFALVYHEYTHLQFSDDAAWLPLWLNEGLAEFMQNTEIRDKDVLLGEPSADNILYLRQNRLMRLDTLFRVDVKSPYYHEEQKGSVFYAESWALTHYLEVMDWKNHTKKISDYMLLVSQHEDPAEAAEKAFGNLKQLQSELERYIQADSYSYFKLSSAAAPIDQSSYVSKPLTQPQADAFRADFLVDIGRTQDARDLLASVLKADPDNAQAHVTMGNLASRQGDFRSAIKWYREAMTLDSQNYLAYFNFAVMSTNSMDQTNGADIVAALRASIRLNPRFAPAYDRLAGFFAMRRENLDEAHMLNLQAVQMDPGNLYFRMNAASVLAAMNRYADAETVLRNSVKLAANPSEAAMVESRLNQMEEMAAFRSRPSTTTPASVSGVVDMQTAEKPVDMDDAGPKHPTESPDGPKHTAIGVIRNVQCSYPAVMELNVDSGKKSLSLYSNNYFKIDFSVLGFKPKGDMNPCNGIEGMKAQVQYVESSDKSVDGQVVAIELRK